MDAPRTARHTLIGTLLLVAIVFGLYFPALNYDFVWDDQIYVVRNEAVQDWSRAKEAFTSPRTTWTANADYNQVEWRPLRNISYLIDHSLFGIQSAVGWHLHNIVLHALGTVLLFLLMLRLWRLFVSPAEYEGTPPRAVAVTCFVGALVWAVHPVQTEVVAWVKSRDDLLATPLVFLTLLLALPRNRKARHAGSGAIAVAVVVYVAAILSKENSVVVGALLPILLTGRALCWFGVDHEGYCGRTDGEYLNRAEERRIERRQRLRAAVYVSIVFVIITVALLGVRDVLLGRTSQAGYPGNFSETVLTMAAAFMKYVKLAVWPWAPTVQMADYDAFPIISEWGNPLSMAGVFILLTIIIIADSTRYRAPLVSLGFLIFLVGMIPFSNIVPMMQIMAERFLYLPLSGLAVMLTGVLMAMQPLVIRKASTWIIALAVVALAWQTRVRLPVWSSEIALFESARAANPVSWRPADMYAKVLLKDGQTTAGLLVAQENLLQWPGDPDIVRTAALAHLLAGDLQAGIRLTETAVRLQPEDNRASRTLQMWQMMQDRAKGVTQSEAVVP